MIEKYYANGRAPLRSAPSGNYLLHIPSGAIVDFTGERSIAPYNGVHINWIKISYRGTVGWAYDGYFCPYDEILPVGVFKNSLATPEDSDVPQNMLRDGKRLVNQCGELCVAYLLDVDIADVLNKWQRKNSWYYRFTFGSAKDRGTDANALLDILDATGEYGGLYANYIYDTVRQAPIETPFRLSLILDQHQVIASVKIDRLTGRLSKSGILHWVVLERIDMERDGGLLYLANPYCDRIERYSWEEYIQARGSVPYGVVFERKKAFVLPSENPAENPAEKPVVDISATIKESTRSIEKIMKNALIDIERALIDIFSNI